MSELPYKTIKIVNNTLGFELPVQIPATAEIFDQLAGKAGTCLDLACRQLMYGNIWNGQFRVLLAKAIAEKLNIEIPDKPDGKKKKRRLPEGGTEEYIEKLETKAFMAKVVADKLMTEAELKVLAEQIAKEVGHLQVTPETTCGKLPKELEQMAEGVVAAAEAGTLDPQAWIDQFETMNPGSTFATFGEWGVDAIARAIRINTDRVEKARAARATTIGLEAE